MDICIINKSEKIAPAQAELIAKACEIQIARDVAPAWGRVPVKVSVVTDEAHVPAGCAALLLCDSPDVANALGYHSDSGGAVNGKIFVDPILESGGAILSHPTGNTVSCTVSHEVDELFGDPWTNYWADRLRRDETALELADAVEADTYTIKVDGVEVTVSNFLYPRWFDPQYTPTEGEKLDHLGLCKKPLEVRPGGYVIVRKADGKSSAIFGEAYPEWKKPGKSHHLSRTAKRLGSVPE